MSQDSPSLVAAADMRRAAVELAIFFNNIEVQSNALHGRDADGRNKVFRMRDALAYRYRAVLFNFELVQTINRKGLAALHGNLHPNRAQDVLLQITLHERFGFDDVVFNSASFLDYVARLVSACLQEDASLKLAWKSLHGWARNKEAGRKRGGNRIHGTPTADLVVEAHRDWVNALFEYRADVIHYHSEKPDGRRTTRVTGQGEKTRISHDLITYVPTGFAAVAGMPTDEGGRASVQDVAIHLVRRVGETGLGILSAAADTLEQRWKALPEPENLPTAPMAVPLRRQRSAPPNDEDDPEP